MSATSRTVLLVMIAACGGVSAALAQPAAPDDRTGGILAGDTSLEGVYLVRDTNGDGMADSTVLFFGAGNESGIPVPTGAVFSIFQAADRTVYIGDGDTDAVYAVRDNNADGDAMDAGEARVWIRGGLFNWHNFLIETPNGLASAGGAIFISNAGAGGSNPDAIFRTIDLNGDGDADDENECAVWFDAFALVPNSTPFDMCMIGATAFFADLRGGNPDVVFRLRDNDMNGQVTADEFGVFLADGDFGAATDQSCVTDGQSVYVHNQSGVQTISRLTDLDASGTVNAPGEATVVWTESALPPGAVVQNSFAIAHGPVFPVRTMAISSHGTNEQDGLLLLRDLSGDGDLLDEGETTVLVAGVAADNTFPESIRSLCFYAPVCRADFDRDGTRAVPDIFAFLSAWFSSDPAAEFDGVEGITVPDIFAFLAEWFGGC